MLRLPRVSGRRHARGGTRQCRGTASAELIVGVGIAQPQNVRIYLYMQLLTYGATATARPSGGGLVSAVMQASSLVAALQGTGAQACLALWPQDCQLLCSTT